VRSIENGEFRRKKIYLALPINYPSLCPFVIFIVKHRRLKDLFSSHHLTFLNKILKYTSVFIINY